MRKRITKEHCVSLTSRHQALPNDGDVGLYIAAVQRRRGRWAEAIAAYEHALAIDPRNQVTLYDASQTYFGLRDWQNALRGLDRVLSSRLTRST